MKNRLPWLRLLMLWLAGVDLRVTLVAIPPLFPLIHRDLPLNETLVAVLLGLPVLLLATASILGSMLTTWLDARRAVILGIAVVGVSSAMRGIGPSLAMLFGMTLVMGMGVALFQPALPALVYHWTPEHIGLATAIYTNGLLAGEVMGAGLTTQALLPLAGSWQMSLALWGIFPLATLVLIWALTAPLQRREAPAHRQWWPNFRDPKTWRLGIIQSGTSLVFWGANAFFPDFLHRAGSTHLIAPALVWLSAGQMLASLMVAIMPGLLVGRARPIQLAAVVAGIGLAIFFIPRDWSRLLGAGLMGTFSALAFVLNLAFPPLLAADSDEVHRISAGMFTIGYSATFLFTLACGALWDRTGIAATALAPVALGVIFLLIGPCGLDNVSHRVQLRP